MSACSVFILVYGLQRSFHMHGLFLVSNHTDNYSIYGIYGITMEYMALQRNIWHCNGIMALQWNYGIIMEYLA